MNYLKAVGLSLDLCATTIRKFIALSLSFLLLPFAAFAQQSAISTSVAADQSPQILEKSKPVERKITEGAKHVYNIALEADQFIRISVSQLGADVVVALIAPDGKQIIEVDSPNGNEGSESIIHIAEISGNYHIEISSNSSKDDSGRYEIQIEEQRKSEAKDKSRILFQQAIIEAVKLSLEKASESKQKAIAKYEEAIKYARETEDNNEVARALLETGQSYNRTGDRKKAIEFFNNALEIYKAANDKLGEASALVSMGEALFYVRDFNKSIDCYIRLLAIYESTGNKRGLSNSLYNLTVLYFATRDYPKALECAHRTLPIARESGNRSVESSTLATIGTIYQQLSDHQKALEYYTQAMPIYTEKDKFNATITLNNIASIHSAMGNYEKSVEIYREILPVFRSLKRKGQEALALAGIGQYHMAKGQYKEALDYYNQSLQIGRTTGVEMTQIVALNQIGKALTSIGDYQQATEKLNEALSLAKAINHVASEIAVLGSLATVAQKSGNLTEALIKVDSLIKIQEDLRPSIHVQDLRHSQSASMHESYAFKINILMQQHKLSPQDGRDIEAFQLVERARARSLLEILRESRADIRQGVDPDLLERERSLQKNLNAKSEALVRLLANKAEQQKVDEAKKDIEITRTDLQQVLARIRAKSPRYAALTQPQPMSLASIQKQILDPETTLLEYSLGKERSYLWVITQTSINSFELPASSEIEAAAKRVYEILTARNKVVKFETADEKVQRVEEAENDFDAAVNALSAIILDPAAAQLKTKKILVVADGALQYIPFSVLPVAQKGIRSLYKPLALNHEIVSIPSASTLGALRCELAGRQLAPKSIAIFADPVFESDDVRVKDGVAKAELGAPNTFVARKRRSPISEVSRSARDTGVSEDGIELSRLPFTRKEARTIAALVPANDMKVALDFDANRATAMSSELSNYRYIHFATHSLINSRQPELSGIVLSLVDENGGEQDGFLRTHEIYNLNLPAELVVLSGCQTGLGKQIRGEGIVGITRGFMYAGAARVMVSLWDVNDEATSELMSRFYRVMLSKKEVSPAAALREAQLSMWKEKRWHSPYYWAGFILQGEPN